jgi:hypothetical protein
MAQASGSASGQGDSGRQEADGAGRAFDRPYIGAAFLCEYALLDQDNVPSAIRIIDRVTLSPPEPDAPTQMPAFSLHCWAMLIVRAPQPSRARLELQPLKTDGTALPPLGEEIVLTGTPASINVRIEMGLIISNPGIYWFEVRLDGRLENRFPLEVVYAPRANAASP